MTPVILSGEVKIQCCRYVLAGCTVKAKIKHIEQDRDIFKNMSCFHIEVEVDHSRDLVDIKRLEEQLQSGAVDIDLSGFNPAALSDDELIEYHQRCAREIARRMEEGVG